MLHMISNWPVYGGVSLTLCVSELVYIILIFVDSKVTMNIQLMCVWYKHIHREAEKRNQFSFVCIFFNTWQKVVNVFTYIKESIGYNSIYSFWHALIILHNNEIESIKTSQ